MSLNLKEELNFTTKTINNPKTVLSSLFNLKPMNLKINFLSLIFLFSFISLQSQNNNNQINLNIVEGENVIEDENSVDSLGFNLTYEEDDKSFDNIVYNGPVVQFLYFEWMPGFSLYQNFEVTSVHYKHIGPVYGDTLILENYCHPAKYSVTSNYGKRRRRMHYGIDLGYPTGTPVVAAFDGIVRISQTNAGGYGNLIVLRHNNGLETYYGHLSKRLVNPGQMIHAGDTIGLGGNTGRSYGSHLHFETRYLGIPFNPTKIIDFANYNLKSDTLYIRGCSAVSNLAANNSINTTIQNAPSQQTTSVSSSGSSVAPSKVYYKVKNGDTLSRIAQKYHTSVTKIKKLNGLRSDFLRIGQKLRVK